jgi:hypothetical protein
MLTLPWPPCWFDSFGPQIDVPNAPGESMPEAATKLVWQHDHGHTAIAYMAPVSETGRGPMTACRERSGRRRKSSVQRGQNLLFR